MRNKPDWRKGGKHLKNFSLQIVPLLVHYGEPGSWPGSFLCSCALLQMELKVKRVTVIRNR